MTLALFEEAGLVQTQSVMQVVFSVFQLHSESLFSCLELFLPLLHQKELFDWRINFLINSNTAFTLNALVKDGLYIHINKLNILLRE